MEEARLSKWDTYCFLMNAVVGAGIYIIPKAFQSAGILVSWVLLGFIALVSWLIHVELLAVTDKLTRSPYNDFESNVDSRQLMPENSPQGLAYQWDLPAIIKALFNDYRIVAYVIFTCFAFCMIGTLAAYASMFGTAFGSWFECDFTKSVGDECEWTYRLGTLIFIVLIGVLTVIDYKEQVWLQYIMTGLQFAILIFVVVYCAEYGSTKHLSFENVLWSDYSQICNTFSVLSFAFTYHMCIPSVLAAARGQHQEQKKVAIWMTVSIGLLYGLIGTISSLFLKDLPDNLGLFFKEDLKKQPVEQISFMFSGFALISINLPAIDVISNSGIYGQSLAGIFVTHFYGTNHQLAMRNHKSACKWIRALCVIPPLIFTCYSPQLVSFT